MIPVVKVASTVAVIAGAIVSTVAAIGVLSPYGWVTKQSYEADRGQVVIRSEFERHVKEQELFNTAGQQTQNEILAYVKYVPELESLLRNRCMGGSVPQSVIDDLRETIENLTGEPYELPTCERLLNSQ